MGRNSSKLHIAGRNITFQSHFIDFILFVKQYFW